MHSKIGKQWGDGTSVSIRAGEGDNQMARQRLEVRAKCVNTADFKNVNILDLRRCVFLNCKCACLVSFFWSDCIFSNPFVKVRTAQ
jgi:hypothetical protein